MLNSPTNTLQQAQKIAEAWRNMDIDGTATYGDMTLENFEAAITALDDTRTKRLALEDQLANVRNQYKQQRRSLWEYVKRARAGAKARHGDDSYEYERFGGTRISERRRRAKATRESS